jgi:hypothetical protein
MAAAVLVIAMILTLRVRPPQVALIAQLSADGSAWWDGMSWHQSVFDAPPPPLRSADGRYWWDGRKWRPLPPPKASG